MFPSLYRRIEFVRRIFYDDRSYRNYRVLRYYHMRHTRQAPKSCYYDNNQSIHDKNNHHLNNPGRCDSRGQNSNSNVSTVSPPNGPRDSICFCLALAAVIAAQRVGYKEGSGLLLA